MSTIKEELKNFFSRGKKPREEHYHKWIDRGLFLTEDGNLGIGTENPERILHIQGTGYESDDILIDSRGDNHSGALIFYKSRGTKQAITPAQNGDLLGMISFRGYEGRGSNDRPSFTVGGEIRSYADSNFSERIDSSLRFYTRNNGARIEALRITPNGHVAIGTTSAHTPLHVKGNADILTLEGEDHAYMEFFPRGVGEGRKAFVGFGNRNTDRFHIMNEDDGSLILGTNGAENLVIDVNGRVGIENNLHVGGGITTTGSMAVARITGYGSGLAGEVVEIESMGVIIGRGNGQINVRGNLWVDGIASKPGGGTWETDSDKRIKQDIKAFTDGMAKVRKLNPVTYKYNGKANTPKDGKEYVGFIAQDIQEHCPYMIKTYRKKLEDSDDKETELLSLDATHLQYILLNAVKELDNRISKLEEDE